MTNETADPEYHRRRAEAEMDRALHARLPTEALVHLELARIHREKREELALVQRCSPCAANLVITRTDKEC